MAALAVAATAIATFGAGTADASPACTIYWTGKTSTLWGTVTNWSLTNGGGSAGHAPEAKDYVCMSTSPTNATPTIGSTGSVTVAGINWGEAGAVQPNLTVSGKLTVGDSTAVDASTIYQLSVTGTLVSYKGEAITATNLTLSGTLDGPGTLTVSGPATLSSGASLGTYATPGTAAHLVLQGATTVMDGTEYFSGGSELENEGTLTLQDEAYLENYDGNAANKLVNDSGATVSYTGLSSATVEVPAVNNGTVAVHEGTLTFGGGTGRALTRARSPWRRVRLWIWVDAHRGVGGDDQWGGRSRYHGHGDVHRRREPNQHRHLRGQRHTGHCPEHRQRQHEQFDVGWDARGFGDTDGHRYGDAG